MLALGDPGRGVTPLLLAVSNLWPPAPHIAGHYQVPRYPWLGSSRPIVWAGFAGGGWTSIPSSGALCGYVVPYLLGNQGPDTEHNGVAMSNCGHC